MIKQNETRRGFTPPEEEPPPLDHNRLLSYLLWGGAFYICFTDIEGFEARRVEEMVAALPPRLRYVIRLRYSEKPATLRDIAGRVGRSVELIRQKESRALSVLRHPSRLGWARTFLDVAAKESLERSKHPQANGAG